MIRPQTLRKSKQGPRVAAQQMKAEGLSSMLVIDNNHQLLGYVTDEDVLAAVKSGIKNFDSIMRTDIPKVSKDTLIYDLYDIIHDSDTPVAVVDDNNKLQGIVIRSLVIGALAREREEDTNNGE